MLLEKDNGHKIIEIHGEKGGGRKAVIQYAV